MSTVTLSAKTTTTPKDDRAKLALGTIIRRLHILVVEEGPQSRSMLNKVFARASNFSILVALSFGQDLHKHPSKFTDPGFVSFYTNDAPFFGIVVVKKALSAAEEHLTYFSG